MTMQPPLPANTPAAEVTKMEKALGPPTTQKIIGDLQTHYTLETRKQ